ncbi:hypothetical protein SAMN05216360_114188 [Methylobacterium phyllostachyos]|uniref:Uncharacterized protein n=1 Tax=Methylobacterium phyllostachyos TaxID=582672 RepID=A0A1H0GR75_9HYPH|nr:hypothetical protein [Methylobacterium phyllostachyos]SDO09272.1 hypothetical protein SAMN05216360_114188 [Methylobacterium phyllostachyos]
MFENLFWGATLIALICVAALVAIGAAHRPRDVRRVAEVVQTDPRRSFGRKRGWRRLVGAPRRPGSVRLR